MSKSKHFDSNWAFQIEHTLSENWFVKNYSQSSPPGESIKVVAPKSRNQI